MEITPIYGKTGIIEMPFSTVTIYRLSQGQAVLVDSGDYPRPELLELLEREGLAARAVFCTHLHPDHISNNPALVERYGTEIFAHEAERGSAKAMFDMLETTRQYPQWTEIRPVYPVTWLSSEQEEVTVDGAPFRILQTPGHSFGHIAVVTPDGVCCLGDAMMSVPRVRQAKLPYMEDADQAIESMERIRETQYPFYVTAHKGAAPLEALALMVDENVRVELELYDRFLRMMDHPRTEEEAIRDFLVETGTWKEEGVSWFVKHSAETRLMSLIRSGELKWRDGTVYAARQMSRA